MSINLKIKDAWGNTSYLFLLSGMLAWLLAGCSQVEYLPPPPTPQAVELDHSPALRTWQPALYACAATLPEMALFTHETPASRLDAPSADLVLRLGAPQQTEGFYSAQVGEEQIIVIAHPDNPIKDIDEATLRQLYTGQAEQWEAVTPGFVQPVQVWTYPDGEDTRQLFEAALFAESPPQVQGFLAPDPQAMLAAVSTEPGALGYLPRSWLVQGDVNELVLTADLASRLLHPVLAVTNEEPQGMIRSFLSCLQNAQK